MKKKFSKILGVGLTLALLTSLLLTAAPVMAATAITDLTVSVSDLTISEGADYTITFDATNAVTATADGSPYDIIIAFPLGVTVPATWGATDISLQSTAGFGTENAVKDLPVNNIFTIAATGTAGPIVHLDLLDVPFVDIGEAAMVRVKFKNLAVTNPSSIGTFTLTVKTSADITAVPVTYTTTVPTIDPLPGVVEVRNPSNILINNFTGPDAIYDAIGIAGADYVINVGAGTYEYDLTIPATHTDLELVGAEGAIIKGLAVTEAAVGLRIDASGVKVHGFTIETSDASTAVNYIYGIVVANEDVEIYDNAFVATCAGAVDAIMLATDSLQVAEVSGLSIHDNTFTADTEATVSSEGVYVNHNSNHSDPASTTASSLTVTIADNEFGGNIFRAITTERSKTTISGNTIVSAYALDGTFPAQAFRGIDVSSPGTNLNPDQDAVVVTGNTVTGFSWGISLGDGAGNNAFTGVSVTGNTLEDNDVGVRVRAGADGISVNFNDIIDSVTLGVENTDVSTVATLDATFNWWGTDVAADVAALASDDVTYEPFLAGTAGTVLSATKVGTGLSLDAKTDVGVKVSVANADAVPAPTISVAKYIANPQEAIADAIAFYDVYVAGVTATAATTDPDPAATIKFYVGDANSEVWIWSAETETWGAVIPVEFSSYGGYVYVTVDVDVLGGTPFAVVGGAAAVLDTPPEILSPVTGDDTVRLRPVFAWLSVAGADGYYFQLADNAEFVVPLVKMEGDMGRLSGTTYAYVGEALPYSTPYHWRVKAVSGTEAAGDLAESDWAGGVFITMDEPVEPTPPVVVEEQPPVIIEPIVEVEVITPATTEITPAWIYVIIGVGGVLVIALLVLIVRTRRVA